VRGRAGPECGVGRGERRLLRERRCILVRGQIDHRDDREVGQIGVEHCHGSAEFALGIAAVAIGGPFRRRDRLVAMVMLAARVDDLCVSAPPVSAKRVCRPVRGLEGGQRKHGAEGKDGSHARHGSGSLGRNRPKSKDRTGRAASLMPCDALRFGS